MKPRGNPHRRLIEKRNRELSARLKKIDTGKHPAPAVPVNLEIVQRVRKMQENPAFAWAAKKWPNLMEHAAKIERLPHWERWSHFDVLNRETRIVVVNLLPSEIVQQMAEQHTEILDWLI